MTIEADPLRGNAVLVDALSSALRRGDHALGTVPDLLKRVLAEGSWREFVTQRGELVRHERFADFVAARPLQGLGATVDLVRRVVADDVAALDLLDRELKAGARPGERRDLVNNINEVAASPRGTSKEYALRRLRKDRPDLHTEVLEGRISPHAAMVAAGFRPKTFTVRVDSVDTVINTLRRQLPPEMLGELAARLVA